jgi:hypothetical protein
VFNALQTGKKLKPKGRVMQFKPMTEEEIQMQNLLTEGKYKYVVIAAEDTFSGPHSKNPGQDLIKLTLEIYDSLGRKRLLSDYFSPAFLPKVKNFCDVNGLQEQYNAGTLLATDCLGKSGNLFVVVKKGRPNPEGGNYNDSNAVKCYLADDGFVEEALPF